MSQTHDTERSGIETVVCGLLRDVRALVRQEMALAQHEVQYEIGKILKSVLWCGIAAVLALTGLTALIGLLLGMTLFLYALQGSQTGIIATLSATSPVIILPLLWLRTGQRPSGKSWAGALLAVLGLALIFTR